MRPTAITTGISCLILAALAGPAPAAGAQSWSPPPRDERCPSKWGAGDELGAANHMGPETVLRAARLIREGRVIELGQVLSSDMPLGGTRHFDLYMKPTRMSPESNARGSNEEIVVAEMGQVGTQFDGFTHQTIGDDLYNCIDQNDVMTRSGFTRLGIENVGTLMTRGVLIDVAALKGVAVLPESYEITVDDLQQALDRQQVALEPGDAVIHTGSRTGTHPERFSTNGPGIGLAAGEWLWSTTPCWQAPTNPPGRALDQRTGHRARGRRVARGARPHAGRRRQRPGGGRPQPEPGASTPVHQIMLVINGIHLVERMKLDELAAAGVYEFAFVVQPLKLKGATGSTVAPVAIY